MGGENSNNWNTKHSVGLLAFAQI